MCGSDGFRGQRNIPWRGSEQIYLKVCRMDKLDFRRRKDKDEDYFDEDNEDGN